MPPNGGGLEATLVALVNTPVGLGKPLPVGFVSRRSSLNEGGKGGAKDEVGRRRGRGRKGRESITEMECTTML